MAAVLSKAGNNSISSSQRALQDCTGSVAYPSPLWTRCRLQPTWGGMGLSLCPSSMPCLSAGLLLAKSLVPSPHPHPSHTGQLSPYEWAWSWQSFYSAHLQGHFPVGGKRGGQQKREKEKLEGKRRGNGLHFYNHMAGLGGRDLGTWEQCPSFSQVPVPPRRPEAQSCTSMLGVCPWMNVTSSSEDIM